MWLVTNCHVLTGRRPDRPGALLNDTPQSPYKIEVTFPGPKVGSFLTPVTLSLYEDGKPIWREYAFDKGVDLAAIPVSPPKEAIAPCIQDFSDRDTEVLSPGADVVVIGYPFEHSIDMPFPVWKRAMVATEPAYTVFGVPQVLLDSPGTPGMSGSPVFRLMSGLSLPVQDVAAINDFHEGKRSALDALADLDPSKIQSAIILKWIGVYAGATGSKGLEQLNLGRMFHASMVDVATHQGLPGQNPYPPEPFPP